MLGGKHLLRSAVFKFLTAMGSVHKNPSSQGASNVCYTILEEGTNEEQSPAPSVLSWAYYQRYLNVDTKHVTERIISSVIPRPSKDFLTHFIRPLPDFYGPFWLCITLTFALAISSNVLHYYQADNRGWRYDFNKVSVAGSITVSYVTLVPILLWVFLWWRNESHIGIIELLSMYGYSLAVFIPVSLLWMVPFPLLQWTLLTVATVLSGSVIALSLFRGLCTAKGSTRYLSAATAFVFHFLFAITLFLCLFQHPKNSVISHEQLSNTPSSDDLLEKTIHLKPVSL